MSLAPGQNLLHYQLVEQIGVGAMGVVYKATDTKLRRDVAIKVLPDNFANDQERLARFEREAHVLASLNHPAACLDEAAGRPGSRRRAGAGEQQLPFPGVRQHCVCSAGQNELLLGGAQNYTAAWFSPDQHWITYVRTSPDGPRCTFGSSPKPVAAGRSRALAVTGRAGGTTEPRSCIEARTRRSWPCPSRSAPTASSCPVHLRSSSIYPAYAAWTSRQTMSGFSSRAFVTASPAHRSRSS